MNNTLKKEWCHEPFLFAIIGLSDSDKGRYESGERGTERDIKSFQ